MSEDVARSVDEYYKLVSGCFGLRAKSMGQLATILGLLAEGQESIAKALKSIDEASGSVARRQKGVECQAAHAD